jgi:hypothetical protein
MGPSRGRKPTDTKRPGTGCASRDTDYYLPTHAPVIEARHRASARCSHSHSDVSPGWRPVLGMAPAADSVTDLKFPDAVRSPEGTAGNSHGRQPVGRPPCVASPGGAEDATAWHFRPWKHSMWSPRLGGVSVNGLRRELRGSVRAVRIREVAEVPRPVIFRPFRAGCAWVLTPRADARGY